MAQALGRVGDFVPVYIFDVKGEQARFHRLDDQRPFRQLIFDDEVETPE